MKKRVRKEEGRKRGRTKEGEKKVSRTCRLPYLLWITGGYC